jgi:MFS family permease
MWDEYHPSHHSGCEIDLRKLIGVQISSPYVPTLTKEIEESVSSNIDIHYLFESSTERTASNMNHSRRDIATLFTTSIIRLFAYGFLSVVLALYLAEIGLTEQEIGLLFTLTLLGDAGVSLWITTRADRMGRRSMLIVGASLMIFSGIIFALTANRVLLIAAAIIGVISPSGKEIGPFLSIEQAALSQLLPNERRTQVFAWYNVAGSFAGAIGALTGGMLAQRLQLNGFTAAASYRALVFGYASCGVVMTILFLRLSSAIEVSRASLPPFVRASFGLHRSKIVVMKLSALFGLDAFAGGFIVQSMIAYWFFLKFHVSVDVLGGIFFGTNIIAGLSALFAVRVAKRIGLVNTMVFTHLPSNILLCLVPLMPTLPWAIGMLLLRFSISQMDVPTRQSYTMAVVSEDERSAASGVTTIARSLGASISPALTGVFLGNPALLGLPFFLAGGLKIVYDVLIYSGFRRLKPPEESIEDVRTK